MEYKNRFVYIRDKKPQVVSEAIFSPRTIILKAGDSLVDNGVINLVSGTYAVLHCEEITNISIVTAGTDSRVLTFYIEDKDEFLATVDAISSCGADLTISPQNIKLNSYAVSISEKLKDGIEIRIFDAKTDEDTVECPECGVANDWDPNMPYCMECGAALHHE